MKKLLVTLLTFTSFNAFADTPMSEAEQLTLMESRAKEIRREFHIIGHDEVGSQVIKMSLSELKEYTKAETNSNFEDPLGKDEISSLFKCYYARTCALYRIEIWGEYHGGYGVASEFALLNIYTARFKRISHTIYAE